MFPIYEVVKKSFVITCCKTMTWLIQFKHLTWVFLYQPSYQRDYKSLDNWPSDQLQTLKFSASNSVFNSICAACVKITQVLVFYLTVRWHVMSYEETQTEFSGLDHWMDEITRFYQKNQNTLYLLHLIYSDNEIITVHGRPAICTLIGWIETSQ